MTTYIIGHQKPDTDATVAAMALAALYRQTQSKKYPQVTPVITDPLNPETSYIFKKFNQAAPQQITTSDIKPQDQVILVDHNEESQRLKGLNPEQIVAIIDHHKANLNLTQPIELIFKPLGSSATIVYELMTQANFKPDQTLATLMLTAILSDTVGFKSATCTQTDKQIARKLSQIAQINDLEKLTLEIFKAKSNVSKLADDQIVTNDYKVFDFTQKTFINQIETVEQNQILSRKQGLLQALKKVKDEQQAKLAFVAITDILKVNTKLLCLGDDEAKVAQTAFATTCTDNVADIGPLLSRKKEIAPAIEKALKK